MTSRPTGSHHGYRPGSDAGPAGPLPHRSALRADPDPGKTDGRNPEGLLGIILPGWGSLFSTPAEGLRGYLSTSAFPWAASAQMTKMSSVMIMSDQNG